MSSFLDSIEKLYDYTKIKVVLAHCHYNDLKYMNVNAKHKITFCEKHKRHSKTLREIQRLKQDENAVQISRRTHFCYHVNLFFSGENIQMILSLAREKNNIQTKK